MKMLSTLLTFLALLLFATPVFSNKDVKGTVNYHNEERTPLAGINVFLKDLNGNIVANDVSNTLGKFHFNNIAEGTYTLSASSDQTFDVADLSDAYLLLAYLNGEVQFDEMQLMAADINMDGSVDWNDYMDFIISWFVEGENFMIGSLLFQETEIVVGPIQLKSDPIVEGAASGDTETTNSDDDIHDPKPTIKDRKISLDVTYTDESLVSNQLPIYLSSTEQISGYGIVLNVNNGQNKVVEVLSNNKNINYKISENQIRISWIGLNTTSIDPNEPIFTLKLTSGTEKIHLQLDESSHIIGVDGKKVKATIILPNMIKEEVQSELLPIFPNPIQESASIQYRLSSESKVNLSIYNTTGQLIGVLVDENQAKGNYEVVLNIANLNLQSGNYIYRLNCIGEQVFSDAKIMIIK